ncbi:uncharacterized protein LOC107274903 [Cephus cinctus]|uniref:Uncharacterized protein LOC107274903 n=1 Tax=Cephus cinctus TaxID=211228 RepID=A0AAJ7CHH7_CEPCN|nr:uncharacterized protein LOC107274903 [Cephus cinctus]
MTSEDAKVSKPIVDLEELYKNINCLPEWLETVKLRENAEFVFRGSQISVDGEVLRKESRDAMPKTILCHDMMGGYLEDRFINGSQAYDSYLFYHWNLIDTFIYFSHHLITIPPYGWINTAHRHGVKILGTVITENNNGEEVWKRVLVSEEKCREFANALIHVAQHYGFDGWLLNIENKIEADSIEMLLYFIRYLTSNSHIANEISEIIWYDSVTIEGKLHWQNELNDLNKAFFLACDGIYLNYNITKKGLASSKSLADLYDRSKDVYVGVDVHGRGSPGGGGFDSSEAMQMIADSHLSAAIFAPAWTYEYFNGEKFYEIEDTYWAQLIPYLYIHVPLYDNETFRTSFCRGAGVKYYCNGKVEYNGFYNLSKQKVQLSVTVPNLLFTRKELISEKPLKKIYESAERILTINGRSITIEKTSTNPKKNYFEFHNMCSYNGGGCLKLITVDPKVYHRLLLVYVEFARGIQATIIYRNNGEHTQVPRNLITSAPMLILGNDQDLKCIKPIDVEQIDTQWNRGLYSTTMRSIFEIGLAFSTPGGYEVGEILLEEKQPRFGVILVVFGVLVLVHGASLGGSGAGLWAGAGALVAGALGVIATITTFTEKSQKGNSGFSTAYLASSLVSLALSNMAAITALTAVVRDSQRVPEITLLSLPDEEDDLVELEGGWGGLQASIGLLIASVVELLISGYSCVTLTPRLCSCLRSNSETSEPEGKLKTHNMVHQWVVTQNLLPKNQPIYVLQPVLPMHPMMQPPYATMTPPPRNYPAPGMISPPGSIPIGTPGYKLAVPPHLGHPNQPSSQMMRMKPRRHPGEHHPEQIHDRKRHLQSKNEKKCQTIGEDQVDLAHTYTGLDKRISEEFISIAMDPERKSKASSSLGSDIGTRKSS